MAHYFYDIEIYPNYFLLKMLPLAITNKLVANYIKADINNEDLTEHEIALKLIKFEVYYDTLTKKFIKNDIIEMYKFLNSLPKETIFIGINSLNYDDTIIKFLLGYRNAISPFGYFEHNRRSILITEKLYLLSQDIIDDSTLHPRVTDSIIKLTKVPFISLDVQAYAFETIERRSLKHVQINLNWYNVQELPYPYNQTLTLEEARNVDIYNNNDLLSTRAFYLHTLELSQLRLIASQNYGVNMMNATKSRMADIIIGHYYCKDTGISYWEYNKMRTIRYHIPMKDIILPTIQFKTPELQSFLSEIKKLDCLRDEINIKLQIGNNFFNYKKGGLHSADRPIILKTGDYLLIDVDGTSYYPTFGFNNEVYPAHLNKTVMGTISKRIVNDRIEAKKIKNPMADILKIAINTGFFGKYGDKDSPLFDNKAKYIITINGQLLLIKLIEDLIGIAEPVSANTDGVTFRVHIDKLNEFYHVCREWQTFTNINLEDVLYEKYIRRDVNNYLAIKQGFAQAIELLNKSKEESITSLATSNNELNVELYDKLKVKTIEDIKQFIFDKYLKPVGCFKYKQSYNKGYTCVIIAKALINYFALGIPVEDTIYGSNNIYDFMMSQKMDKKYNVYYTSVIDQEVVRTKVPHAIRYYASKNGGTLTKISGHSVISILSKTIVTIMNKYVVHEKFVDYNINYKYYIGEANKTIITINNQKSKTMRKNSVTNSMFDDYS